MRRAAKSPSPLVGEGRGEGGSGEPAAQAKAAPSPAPSPSAAGAAPPSPTRGEGSRVKASPLARRIAAEKGVDLSAVTGSGPNGRIVKADVADAKPGTAVPQATQPTAAAPAAAPATAEPKAIWFDDSIPHTADKLSNIRKTIARRLTEAKQTIPHIYLTVDIRLDALLKLRGELNAALEPRGVKLSVNDLLIKALGVALIADAQVQRHLRGRPADQLPARRRVGRGFDAVGADHADHPRRREQQRVVDLDPDEGTGRARPRQQVEARGISGRHRLASATWACTGSSSSRRSSTRRRA